MKPLHAAVTLALIPGLAAASAQIGFEEKEPREPVPRRLAPDAADFLGPYGLGNFSQHYVDALQTFLDAEYHVFHGDPTSALEVLDPLWAAHPPGGTDWSALPSQPFGINIGSPPTYYALRMLTDIAQWRVSSGTRGSEAPRTARLTVILVGHSAGIEPQDVRDLTSGGGVPVVHDLEPALLQNDHRIVRQSLRLFREYVLAMTDGKLGVETHFLSLPDLTLPVRANVLPGGGYFAGLQNNAQVWESVPQEVREDTDWWWLLYPSHVPEQHPDFTNAEFITGGMGVGHDDTSPLFLIDDRWLVRKPPHIGTGPYTDVERRAYLPQWLQHEFYHHLYRTYPEFGLEQTPHQWFDRSTWPSDFEGRFEPDYYHQSLHLRLAFASPPMHVALRYATGDAPWSELTLADIAGNYRREPVQNDWHVGTISQVVGNSMQWNNTAGVSWLLQADLSQGLLLTGPDCPYYDPPNGTRFHVVLERDEIGDLTSEVAGFSFLGELYERQ